MASRERRSPRSPSISGSLLPAAAVTISALLTSCAVIGPTVPVAPGAGKSPEAFDADRHECMAATDQVLQPIANQLNGPGATPRQVTANNLQIQDAYNRHFAYCMAAKGNVAAQSATRTARTRDGQPLILSDTDTAAASPTGGPLQGWRLLALSYHAPSGRPKDINDALWPREIANPPGGPGGALPIYSVAFVDGARTFVLSIAGQGPKVCDDGPNTASSTRDYGVCPAKLAIVEDGKLLASHSAGRLCAETINDGGVQPGAPGWQDPARWGTRARYDGASGSIEVLTMQNGRSQPDCGKRLGVR